MIPLSELIAPIKGESKSDKCACPLCNRVRKINRICKSLKQKDSDWLIGFHDYLVALEDEREMREFKQGENHAQN